MSEFCETFEELGIKEGPKMISDFYEKYDRYPVLELQKPSRMPTRYTAPGGEKKFHMKTIYRPGEQFSFAGTEPGKRSPDAVNVVLKHPTDPDSEIVVTTKDLANKMWVNMSKFGDDDDLVPDPLASIPPKPTYSDDVKTILQKRKKEAPVSI